MDELEEKIDGLDSSSNRNQFWEVCGLGYT